MSSNVSISLAASTVTVTKVTTLTPSCLTSVWILTSVSKADLIAIRALILKEGNKTSVLCIRFTVPSISPLFSLDYLAVFPFHATCSTVSSCEENRQMSRYGQLMGAN